MDTILTYGAQGECVSKLTALARAAGIDIGQTDQLDTDTLDKIVTGIGLGELLDGTTPSSSQPYKGRLVTQAVWDELRARAATQTDLEVPAPPGTDASPAAAPTAATGAPDSTSPFSGGAPA